jgi:hypothetical protein
MPAFFCYAKGYRAMQRKPAGDELRGVLVCLAFG